MEKIKIWNEVPSADQAQAAADIISRGELAIIPTDSVYAIVCDALDSKAIAALCRLKGINPDKNNLSILCSDISMAAEYAHIDNNGFRMMREHTPGAVTFLFRASHSLPRAFKSRKTVGIRIPDNQTALSIVKALGHPVLSTSIEFPDSDHAREPELIEELYANRGVALIVDDGDGGDEFSTILDCTDSSRPTVVREGKVQFDD